MSRSDPSQAEHVVVAGGGPCPRDDVGRPRSLFRAGDVVRVSCPFTETEVVSADERDVRVRWPWRQGDAGASAGSEGVMVLPLEEESRSLFQVAPEPGGLRRGGRCRVGIPIEVVHVVAVRRWFPDQDLGWRRRCLSVWVLRQGVAHNLGEDVKVLDPYGSAPVRVEQLARPYPFLDDLDVVADRRGRRWEFCSPYWWAEPDRDDEREGIPAPLAGPAWPLALLAGRDGDQPDPVRTERVAQATAQGDHAAHLAAWSGLVGAAPTPAEQQHAPVHVQPFLDAAAAEAVRAQVRASLRGLSYSGVLRAFIHTWEERLRSIRDTADVELGPMLERLELQLDELASALRQLRASGPAASSG